MTKKQSKEYAEQYKETLSGKTKEEAKEILLNEKFEEADADKVISAVYDNGSVFAARRFADKNTGKIYEIGDDITHLGEDRHNELKQRGFISND